MGWFRALLLTLLTGSMVKTQTTQCGVPSEPLSGVSRKRVVGGTATSTRSFPWTVLLKRYGHSQVVCGGAILTNRFILTAAHCFDRMSRNDMYVSAGIEIIDDLNLKEQIRHATNIIIHEEYYSSSRENDIALIRVANVFNFDDYVRPICFPGTDFELPEQQEFLLAGYGETQNTAEQRRLNYMRVPLVDDDTCAQNTWLGEAFNTVREVSFCAGYPEGGPDACTMSDKLHLTLVRNSMTARCFCVGIQYSSAMKETILEHSYRGDSGGALVTKRLNEDNYYVYGVSSWGRGCGESQKPGVYTRIISFVDWVRDNSDITLDT